MINLPGKWKQWTATEEIGSGSFGTVYKAENTENGEVAAIKVIPVRIDSSNKNFLDNEEGNSREYHFDLFLKYKQEIAIMQQLKNRDNIVKILDSHVEENEDGNGWTIYIMMEYLRNISDIMMGWDQVEEKDVAKLGVDICKAIEACAEQNIIHRDIKPENILVSEDGIYKLGDFGVAKHIEQTIATASIRGTYSFMAPEIIQMKKYSKKVDVYSLGMILYRFMNRNRDPFIDLNKKIVFYQDKEASMERRLKGEELPSPVDASEEFAEIILKACEYSAEDRYDIEEFKSDLLKFIAGKYQLKNKREKKTRYYNISNKNIKKWFAAAICLVMCIIGCLLYYIPYDAGFEFKDIQFGQNGHCTLRNGTLVIEGRWDYNNDNNYPWHGYEDKIEKVELVGNITYIGWEAFNGCSSLKSITGLENVTYIDSSAFNGCVSLEKIDGIDFSKPDCFFGSCFDDTPWLESRTENGFFIIDDKLIRYNGKEENIKLPENVTIIGSEAFKDCDSIKSITGLENVREIGGSAFEDCSSLESITGLENVTVLECSAFMNCVFLERIEGLDFTKIDYVSSNVFENTPWLKANSENGFFIVKDTLIKYNGKEESIKLPENVRIIGDAAFWNCESIKCITGLENVTEIGSQAFSYSSLMRIEGLDFTKMDYLSADAFDDTPWLVSHTENGFFIIDDKLIRYSGKEENISLPESVRKIGCNAFWNCDSIKSITGLENVTEIADCAFQDCSYLESLSGLNNVSSIGEGVFYMCYSLKNIEGKKKGEILKRDDLGLEDTKVFE